MRYKEFDDNKKLGLKIEVTDMESGFRDLLLVRFLLENEREGIEKNALIVIAGANRCKMLRRKEVLGSRLDVGVPFISVVAIGGRRS